jgi:8-oxo-dGTP diphosphatase
VSGPNDTVARPFTAVQLIFKHEEQVALILREHTGWMDGFFCLPGGRVEQNEAGMAAAIREANEETGVVLRPEELQHALTVHDASGTDSIWLQTVFEVLRWEGELYNAEPQLHAELAWFDLKSLPKNILPVNAYYFELLNSGKTYGEFGWEKTVNKAM